MVNKNVCMYVGKLCNQIQSKRFFKICAISVRSVTECPYQRDPYVMELGQMIRS